MGIRFPPLQPINIICMTPIVTVGFNQPEITNLCIKQIRRWCPDSPLVLFDNSSKKSNPDVDIYLDNTSGKLINFNDFLRSFPNKSGTNNNWGSAKHSKTIDYLFSIFPKEFILIDCDFIATSDITKIADSNFVTIGNIEGIDKDKYWRRLERIHPALQYFNTEMINKRGIKFFDPNRNYKLVPGPVFDTGQSFLQDVRNRNLPIKYINMKDYGIHFGGSTWGRNGTEINEFIKKFTSENNS